LKEFTLEIQQAERSIKTLTHDMAKHRTNLNEKQFAKGGLQAEINGKKSELLSKQKQKLAQESQLHAVENQVLANKQSIRNVERQMYNTQQQIERQTTLQQETKRLCDEAKVQLQNTEHDVNRLNRELNEKQMAYDRKKKNTDILKTQAEQRRTSQRAVGDELSQLSSSLISRRAKIARTEINIYHANNRVEAHQTKQVSQTNTVTKKQERVETCDEEEDHQLVTNTQKLHV
jgi:chromosome segregation ATPase